MFQAIEGDPPYPEKMTGINCIETACNYTYGGKKALLHK